MLIITITTYPHCWGAYASAPYLFTALKASVVWLIGRFCSANPPPILISSCMTWCSNQPINGFCNGLAPPPPSCYPMYILLISCHANFQLKTSIIGIPSQSNPQQTKQPYEMSKMKENNQHYHQFVTHVSSIDGNACLSV